LVYILRCSDGSLYVGRTSDIEQRVNVHNDGHGAAWTGARRPVTLLYQEKFASEQRAITRERQLKHWTHHKKLALINADRTKLRALSKRRII
jgi:predicted GIY-YIG superfamily endonuclease